MNPSLTGTAHVPTSLERGFVSYSHQMKKARRVFFERQSDGVFARIGYCGVCVGHVDRDEFSVRSFFQLRTIFFTIDRLTAFRDVLARRSRTNKLFRHSASPSTAIILLTRIGRLCEHGLWQAGAPATGLRLGLLTLSSISRPTFTT